MDFKEKIFGLFKNTYIEINKNHNEAVNAFKNFCNINNCTIPIMVNYDTHSDVHLNSKQINIKIGNWVNFCYSQLGVVEYYWIIPNYIIKNPYFKKCFSPNENLQKETFHAGPMRPYGQLNDILEEQLLLNKKTSELITVKKLDIINEKNKKFGLPEIIGEEEGFTPVKLFIVPFDKISVLKEKETVLSLDADFFCNSGHETIEAINNVNISQDELKHEFEVFINVLYENHIKIKAASLTRSPAYFPDKFDKEINEFFFEIKNASSYKLLSNI